MREDAATEWTVMLRVSDAPEFARRLVRLLGEVSPPVEPSE
jgi:hypothetical protein